MPKFNAEELTETDDLDEVESEIFCWQQKQFNAHELSYFQKADNCKTDAQKRYNQEILANERDGNGRRSRIFSYVMDDKFVPPIDELDESRDYQLVQNVDNYGEWSEPMDGGRLLCGRLRGILKLPLSLFSNRLIFAGTISLPQFRYGVLKAFPLEK